MSGALVVQLRRRLRRLARPASTLEIDTRKSSETFLFSLSLPLELASSTT